MNRLLLSVAAVSLFAVAAQAHMVYFVPAKEGKAVVVVFSDSLEADEKVKMDKLAGLKMFARIAGKDAPVEFVQGDHSFTAKLAESPTIVYGSAVYGLLPKSEKPTLLIYHPKAITTFGDVKTATIGADAALEIVPVAEAGKTRFQLLAKGKPVADAEGTVTLPDGVKEKVTTDKNGFTQAFGKTGRYAAYFKLIEDKTGEHDGKKYEEVRHYATLVADLK